MVALFFFLIVAIIVSNLTAATRRQVVTARARAKTTAELYAFSRKVAGIGALDDLLWATAFQIASMLNVRTVLLMPVGDWRRPSRSASGYPPEDQLDAADMAAARWTWEHNRPAGRGADTLPGGKRLFLPCAPERPGRRARHRPRNPGAAADPRRAAPARRAFRWGMLVKQDRTEAYAIIDRQLLASGLLLALTVASVAWVAWWVARSISRPIREAALVADRVAAGDLTATCLGKAPGEAGLLLQAIRKMTTDLRSLIGRIQRSSVALMSTATEISATSKQQEQTVYDYGTSTNEAAAAVNEISATSQELLRTMNEVNQLVTETTQMARPGRRAWPGWTRPCGNWPSRPGRSAPSYRSSANAPANINLVVTTITKVADQTNLLSINAAIEAEKAGEYGLGFLVVAREIRRLADQTAVATLDIERMVKEMQYSVSAGVMEMDKFSEQVRQVVGEVAPDRRPAWPDHQGGTGPRPALRPGDRGHARAVAGRRPDPRGDAPAHRRRQPDFGLAPRVQQGDRPPPRGGRGPEGGGLAIHRGAG